MRDILVTLLFAFGVFQTLRKPHAGILVWSWLAYMNPHRLCYGFAYSLPLSYIIALVTTMAYMASHERKSLPKDKLVVLIFAFIAWMTLTTQFSMNPSEANDYLIRVLKIQFPILLTMAMFTSKQRIHQLLWIIIGSIGYFGVKGGVFTVLSGGGYHVFGPPESFIEENNSLAVAELMVIPLMVYMRGQLNTVWHRQLMLFCVIAMTFSALGSQSRGAFLAISAVGGYFWLQSKRKLPMALGLIVLIVLLYLFLPASWYQRMDTIKTYDQDESALGRIRAWTLAFNIANSHLLGGGFQLWTIEVYKAYLPGFTQDMSAFVAHSIYFHVLGEHGWIGLGLFLVIFSMAWRYCSQIVTLCKNNEDKKWASDLAKMIKLSLLAYLSGGAFLSLSYLDLSWHLVALVILLKEIATRPIDNTKAMTDERVSVWRENQKKISASLTR
ncbi:MAG: putative O-glycosylation ligase, exosortase A system-associated [Methylovulum sp.]|nr:putative O-glycosylation ligase, exosortase A system-associated [Methylovulum sp.]